MWHSKYKMFQERDIQNVSEMQSLKDRMFQKGEKFKY